MAGESARTGTVNASETSRRKSATVAASHEILRRMLVSHAHFHLASFLVREPPACGDFFKLAGL
jgi:hypothetical protein